MIPPAPGLLPPRVSLIERPAGLAQLGLVLQTLEPSARARPEGAREFAGAVFDGAGRVPPSVGEPPQAGLPGYLSAARPEDGAWLSLVVREASRSRTGRRVLRGVEKLSAGRGRPVLVLVSPITNNGEFSYDWEIVTLDSAHKKREAALAAPILIHELEHVVQRASGLPADAFEMELEAYVTAFRVYRELELEPPPGSFDRKALKRFLTDLPKFIEWLKGEYSANIALLGSSLEEYRKTLGERAKAHGWAIARRTRELKKKQAVLAKMEAEGHPEALREAYKADEIVPAEGRLRRQKASLEWIRRDEKLLDSPEGRRRYASYAARVDKKARAARQALRRS